MNNQLYNNYNKVYTHDDEDSKKTDGVNVCVCGGVGGEVQIELMCGIIQTFMTIIMYQPCTVIIIIAETHEKKL